MPDENFIAPACEIFNSFIGVYFSLESKMSPHQTLAVAVRLAAIWLFLYAISTMAGAYVEAHKYSAPDSLLPLFLGLGVVMLICSLLWFFPFFVAKRLLPPSTTDNNQSPLFDGWFSVGCSLIGVWVLAKAIPALVSYVLSNYLGGNFWPDTFVVNPDWVLLVSFNAFHLIVGIWLFLGGKGLKKILIWARHA